MDYGAFYDRGVGIETQECDGEGGFLGGEMVWGRVREGSLPHAGSILASASPDHSHLWSVVTTSGDSGHHHTIHLGVLCHGMVS